jgi:hypothetical protein
MVGWTILAIGAGLLIGVGLMLLWLHGGRGSRGIMLADPTFFRKGDVVDIDGVRWRVLDKDGDNFTVRRVPRWRR